MPAKSLMFLTSAPVAAGLAIEPLAANAAGLHQTGTWGRPVGVSRSVSNLRCDGVPGVGSVSMRPMTVPGVGNMSAFRPNVTPGVNSSFNRPLNVLGGDTGNRRSFNMGHAPDVARGAFGTRPLNVTGGAEQTAETFGQAGPAPDSPRPFARSSRPLNVQGGDRKIDVTNNFNFVKNIDPKTGELIGRVPLPMNQETLICPSTFGARSWNAGAYNPKTGL